MLVYLFPENRCYLNSHSGGWSLWRPNTDKSILRQTVIWQIKTKWSSQRLPASVSNMWARKRDSKKVAALDNMALRDKFFILRMLLSKNCGSILVFCRFEVFSSLGLFHDFSFDRPSRAFFDDLSFECKNGRLTMQRVGKRCAMSPFDLKKKVKLNYFGL